ncbi:GreA/GreB family elongation factor [Aequorivita lipolytica]|uniref:GreA/GreB family elongation factor n=1 Tax=Aequorivita lipolytica TaxID=153267 RepID=A0A5C6YPX2_9FLAO|nr:GreA/GreB family elongation factor [Aequorivita lipolytica]TXD68948.1 GreA/GreB family elongation factor [Aequorivita lipolytica]SRX53080.1 Transcription elongation factor GreA [Aequorivita lipolytica]
MSRGFVKEGDQEETPIIPPRAALPAGATNYVTPTGMKLLRKEREQLENERANLATTHEQQRRIELAVLNGKLDLLNERIVLARILDPTTQPKDEVRFGATVTYKISTAPTPQKFQIVGVDEADVAKRKIAFVAPIAVALTGHKVGDVAPFNMGGKATVLKVISIEY